MVEKASNGLSREQSTVYDRQIRLWGLDVQQRLSSARLLFIGISGSAVEILKNVVLSGVGEVILHDPQPCSERDLEVNFLLEDKPSRSEGVVKAVQGLNKFVKVSVHNEELKDDFLTSVNIVITSEMDPSELLKLSKTLRKVQAETKTNIASYHLYAFGAAVIALTDMNKHEYLVKTPALELTHAVSREKRRQLEEAAKYDNIYKLNHPEVSSILSQSSDDAHCPVFVHASIAYLNKWRSEGKRPTSPVHGDFPIEMADKLQKTAGYTMVSVTSVAGGLLSADIIRVASKSEAIPYQNAFVYEEDPLSSKTGGAASWLSFGASKPEFVTKKMKPHVKDEEKKKSLKRSLKSE